MGPVWIRGVSDVSIDSRRPPTNSSSGSSADGAGTSYQRTKGWLLDYIAERKLGPGDKIPSERILADALSLSRPTVARAVSELVKEGVLASEQRVGTYVGGYSSRRLGARIGTIGIVMPWLSQGRFGQPAGHSRPDRAPAQFRREGMCFHVFQGVMSVLKGADFRLVVQSNANTSEEADVLRGLTNEGLDGALIIPSDYAENAEFYARIAKGGPPAVLVDHYLPDCPLDRVVTDNLAGARQAVEHLVQQGHTRIAHFTDFEEITSTMDRELGYRVALENAGIPYDEGIVCGPQLAPRKLWSFEHALEHCLNLPNPITAVFCINDDAVIATLQAASRFGIGVPGDLAVAGFFDDTIPDGMDVPFARVIQGKTEMGETAAKLLLERLGGAAPRVPRHVLVPTQLIPSNVTHSANSCGILTRCAFSGKQSRAERRLNDNRE